MSCGSSNKANKEFRGAREAVAAPATTAVVDPTKGIVRNAGIFAAIASAVVGAAVVATAPGAAAPAAVTHVLLHPSSRPVVVPEAVRVAQNSMMWLILQSVFARFPERLPVDPSPERGTNGFPDIPRAWWLWSHLSDTRAVLSCLILLGLYCLGKAN